MDFQKELELAGMEGALSGHLPAPTTPLYLNSGAYTVSGEGDQAVIQATRRVYDTPPELDPRANKGHGKPDVIWEQQIVPNKDSRKLLPEFIELAEGTQEELQRQWMAFAEQYGLLQLCDNHGLPFRHRGNLAGGLAPRHWRIGDDHTGCLPLLRESWRDWQWLAQRTKTLLQIAGQLREPEEELGKQEYWQILEQDPRNHFTDRADVEPDSSSGTWAPRDLPDAREQLGNYLDQYIEWSGIRPRVGWVNDEPELQLSVPSSFAQLTAQLLSAVIGRGSPESCSECGELYFPKRKPNPNRAKYCNECKTLASRNRKRIRRASGLVN